MTRSDGLMLARLGGDAKILCKRTWWVFLVGGIAGVIFGVLAFSKPVAAWLVVATFFAAAILVDAGFNVFGSVQNRDKDGWWIMLLIGILGVVVGGYALLNPLVSMTAFVYLVAVPSGEKERPFYIGLAQTLTAPARILAPIIGGWIADTYGFTLTFALSTILSIVMMSILIFLVREPRKARLLTTPLKETL